MRLFNNYGFSQVKHTLIGLDLGKLSSLLLPLRFSWQNTRLRGSMAGMVSVSPYRRHSHCSCVRNSVRGVWWVCVVRCLISIVCGLYVWCDTCACGAVRTCVCVRACVLLCSRARVIYMCVCARVCCACVWVVCMCVLCVCVMRVYLMPIKFA